MLAKSVHPRQARAANQARLRFLIKTLRKFYFFSISVHKCNCGNIESLILLIYMTTKQLLSDRKILLIMAAVLFFGGVVFFLHHTQANSDLPTGNNTVVATSASPVSAPTDAAGRDAKRISDLKQVQSELEIYFDQCGFYPGVAHATPDCGKFVANNTWAGVSAALIGSNIHITSVPNDPTIGLNYIYVAMHQGIGYVLGAALEDTTNPALTQSVHGIVNGANCDSPMYCVQL